MYAFSHKEHYCGRYCGDRPIFWVVLHVFRDSERDVGGGGQKWQFQRDVIIEQPLIVNSHIRIFLS